MSRSRALYWALFAVMTALYLTMLLWTLPKLRDMAGGLMPFDLRPLGYTPGEAGALLAALGPEARAFYLDVQQALDSAYPAVLAVVLAMSFRWLAPGALGRALAIVAVIGAVCDYAENHAVRGMLEAETGLVTEAMVQAASRMTIAKSMAATLAFGALAVLLGRAGLRFLGRAR